MTVDISAKLIAQLAIKETFSISAEDDGPAAAVSYDVNASKWAISKTFNAASTPAATEAASFTLALIAGAATINLTALVDINDRAVDATGKKLLAIYLEPLGANAMTFVPGASAGYNVFGATSKLVVDPSGFAIVGKGTNAPVVGVGAKNIDVTGTGTQECRVEMLFGN